MKKNFNYIIWNNKKLYEIFYKIYNIKETYGYIIYYKSFVSKYLGWKIRFWNTKT